MNGQRIGHVLIGVSMVLLLLAGLGGVATAQQPDARPTVQPRATATAPIPGGGGAIAPAETGTSCASLYGTALNWGFGNQGDIGLHLSDGGWHADAVTAGDGRYNFGNLGSGVGILTVDPGALPLTPMVNHAAVRLLCGVAVQANIGLYSGDVRPTPPAYLLWQPDAADIAPGQRLTLTLTVRNTLPNPISNVILTDLFPAGLSIEGAQASQGTVEVLEGRMLTVLLGTVASGGEEAVTVTVQAAETLSAGAELSNVATLFYAESAADQSAVTVRVGGSPSPGGTEPAMTVAGEGGAVVYTVKEGDTLYEIAPQFGVTAEEIMAANGITNPRRLQIGQQLIIPAGAGAAEALAQATAETTESPPPETLPVTGLGVSVSFAAILLAIVALLSRGVRSIKRRP